MVLVLPSEEGLGFLRKCLVEGDPESEKRARRVKQRALALSIALQIIFLALLVVVPLLGKGQLISLKNMTPLPAYARLGSHPRSPERAHTPRPNRPAFSFSGRIPQGIVTRDPVPERQPSDDNFSDSEISRYGATHGDPNGILYSDSANGPKRPPDESRRISQGPIRRSVSEGVQAAQLYHRVEPAYPPLARQLRREGRVELQAIIDTEGGIQSLEVISGDPLLVRSALDAVREWRYHPTILNGQPIEVETHITVIYTLSH